MIREPASAEYVVNYSRAGLVGRFANPLQLPLDHGTPVVVRSARGDQIGVVKAESMERFARFVGPVQVGEIIREPTDDDRAQDLVHEQLAEQLVVDGQEAAGTVLAVLDAEISLCGQTAVLQVLPGGGFDAAAFLETMQRRHGMRFLLHDVSQERSEEQHGCGKPGCGSEGGGGCSSCGSGGGGCSSGNCSSGKVANAQEMTAYFADLRQRMEREAKRVAVL